MASRVDAYNAMEALTRPFEAGSVMGCLSPDLIAWLRGHCKEVPMAKSRKKSRSEKNKRKQKPKPRKGRKKCGS